jgi:DNA-binding PadR family transcriptional regulator
MLRYMLLALLARAPHHGYELKAAFEELLGGTWTLNVGQVYTTLSRLEQDGLIEAEVVYQELLPDRKVYSLTALGRKELARWMDEPLAALIRLRDEVFLKVIAQATASPRQALELIDRQRDQYLEAVSTVAGMRADPDVPKVTGLLLDGLLLRMEADLRWLDLCEKTLRDGAR